MRARSSSRGQPSDGPISVAAMSSRGAITRAGRRRVTRTDGTAFDHTKQRVVPLDGGGQFGPIRIEAIATPHASIGHYWYIVTWHGPPSIRRARGGVRRGLHDTEAGGRAEILSWSGACSGASDVEAVRASGKCQRRVMSRDDQRFTHAIAPDAGGRQMQRI